MSSEASNDLLVKIGADVSDFDLTLEGLLDNIKEWAGEINPVVGLAVAAIGSLTIATVESGDAFETAFQKLEAATGAEGDKIESLKQSLTDTFTSVPISIESATDAVTNFSIKLGLTGDALTALSVQVGNLSLLTGETAGILSNSLAAAFNAWTIATNDQAAAMDYLNQIHQTFGISVSSLAQELAQIAPKAEQLGVSYQQTAVMLGQLNQQGLDASNVMSAFRSIITYATTNSIDLSTALQRAFTDIQNAADAATAAGDAQAYFGSRAEQLAQLITSGKLTLDDFTASTLENGKTINDAAAGIQNFSKAWTDLKNNLSTGLAVPGQAILSSLTAFVQALNGIPVIAKQIGSDLSDAFSGTTSANFEDANDAVNNFNKTLAGTILGLSGFEAATKTAATSQQSMIDWVAANAAALQAQNDGIKEYNTEINLIASAIKAQFQPAILDLTSAQNAATAAHQAVTDALIAEQAAHAQLGLAVDNDTVGTAAYTAATKAATDADAVLKQALLDQAQAHQTLQASQKATLELTNSIASAETAFASAAKALFIPTILDYQTAITNVTTAQLNYQSAIEALNEAEANEQALKDASVKSDADVKAALDATTAAKVNLQAATTALLQANKDEVDSLNLLDKALLEVNSDEIALNNARKTIGPTTDSLSDSYNQYLLALRNVQSATADLNTAELALKSAQDTSGNTTTPQLTAAIQAAKDARTALTQATKDAATAESQLTSGFGLSKDALIVLSTATTDAVAGSAALQAAYNTLGIKSAESLQTLATAADKAYQDILQSGTASSAQLLAAQIADLTAEQNAAAAQGQVLTAQQQITLGQLKQQQTDFNNDQVNQWTKLASQVNGAVSNMASSMINTLFTGNGSFHDEAIKGLESIGAAVVTDLTKPFTDAVASLITGAIKDLLGSNGLGGISDMLSSIGKSISGIFSSASSTASGAAGDAGEAAGAAGDAGDAGSAIGDVASSLSGIIGAIGSIGSMITGAISDIQNIHIENVLGQIEGNTRISALYLGARADQGILGVLFDIDNVRLSQILGTLTSIQSYSDNELMELKAIDYNTYWTLQSLGTINDNLSARLGALTTQAAPNVNVAVTLDSRAIAAAVTVTVEQAIKQAGG